MTESSKASVAAVAKTETDFVFYQMRTPFQPGEKYLATHTRQLVHIISISTNGIVNLGIKDKPTDERESTTTTTVTEALAMIDKFFWVKYYDQDA